MFVQGERELDLTLLLQAGTNLDKNPTIEQNENSCGK